MRYSQAFWIFILLFGSQIHAFACPLLDVLQGDIKLEVSADLQSAVIRNNNTRSNEPFYKLRGSIFESKTGLEISDLEMNTVGFIYKDRAVLPRMDSGCLSDTEYKIQKIGSQKFILLQGAKKIADIAGRFPFDWIK